MASTDGTGHGRTGPTDAFLEDLASRGRVPLLHGVRATVEVDLTDGPAVEKHLLEIDDGVVNLVEASSRTDAVVRAGRSVVDGMATGRINAYAAMLRGELVVEGDLGVLASLFRVFPGPPRNPVTAGERSGAHE